MVDFILITFEDTLRNLCLYGAIRNIQFGLSHNTYHLYSILEMFNPHSGTFFTPVEKLGFALHEMFEVSLLSVGELPYEKYVLTIEELDQLKEKDMAAYETYWKMLCNFKICTEISGMRGQGIGQKT